MSADVQYTFTPDADPNVVKTEHTFTLNGAQAGVVDQTTDASSGLVSYSQISGGPVLKSGDVLTVSTVTTDSFGQSSPAIPGPGSVTITLTPPPPLGVTPGTFKQIGQPAS